MDVNLPTGYSQPFNLWKRPEVTELFRGMVKVSPENSSHSPAARRRGKSPETNTRPGDPRNRAVRGPGNLAQQITPLQPRPLLQPPPARGSPAPQRPDKRLSKVGARRGAGPQPRGAGTALRRLLRSTAGKGGTAQGRRPRHTGLSASLP